MTSMRVELLWSIRFKVEDIKSLRQFCLNGGFGTQRAAGGDVEVAQKRNEREIR
jgi:hypothetical protein